jgi:hypothetical protein
MNAKTIPSSVHHFLLLMVLVIAASGCTARLSSVPTRLPDRIIREFRDMQEHDIVTRVWVRSGFSFKNCRSITVQPVTDVSLNQQPWVAHHIEAWLHEIVNHQTRAEAGLLNVTIYTAVLDTRPDRGRIKGWFSEIDEFPYIEIEMLFADGDTGLPLAKIIHYSRDRKLLSTAVADLLSDLERFFSSSL